MKKVFEVRKGKGKNAAIQQITVKNDEDLKTLGMFVFCGWAVKEKVN